MESIITLQKKDRVFQEIQQGDTHFRVASVVRGSKGDLCGVHVVEIDPGQVVYGYHWHEQNEEVFYVLQGEATVRTPQGDRVIQAGGFIAFPASEQEVHVVRNAGAEQLIYIDFGTRNLPDLVHFPDSETGWACSRFKNVYQIS